MDWIWRVYLHKKTGAERLDGISREHSTQSRDPVSAVYVSKAGHCSFLSSISTFHPTVPRFSNAAMLYIPAFGPIVDVTNKVIFGQAQRRSGI